MLVLGCGIAIAYGLFETSTHVSGAFVVASLATVAAAGRSHFGEGDQAVADGHRLVLAVAAIAAFVAGCLTVIVGRSRPDTGTSAEVCNNTGQV